MKTKEIKLAQKDMKNYYEILEVDPKASDEVIEKAYKILVKRYHPDLNNNNNSKIKMQRINEAYEVISNDFKRREYDEKLEKQRVPIEEYNKIIQENNKLRQELNRIATKNKVPNSRQQEQSEQLQFIRRYYNQIKEVNEQNQTQNETKKVNLSVDKIKKVVIYIGIVLIISIILGIIPFTRKFFINLYNNNVIIKLLVDTIIETFSKGF